MKRRRPGAAPGASVPAPSHPPRVADTTDAPLDASGAVVAFSSAPVVPASSSAGKSGASRDAFVARPSAGPSGAPGELRFTGAAQFRARLVLATLARRPLRIDGIRDADAGAPGVGGAWSRRRGSFGFAAVFAPR